MGHNKHTLYRRTPAIAAAIFTLLMIAASAAIAFVMHAEPSRNSVTAVSTAPLSKPDFVGRFVVTPHTSVFVPADKSAQP